MDTNTLPSHEIGTSHDETVRVRVTANGRIVIPAPIREGLGIREGDELLLAREGNTIRICTYDQAIRRAQDRVARFVPAGAGVEQFIREREDEAKRELREIEDWHGGRAKD